VGTETAGFVRRTGPTGGAAGFFLSPFGCQGRVGIAAGRWSSVDPPLRPLRGAAPRARRRGAAGHPSWRDCWPASAWSSVRTSRAPAATTRPCAEGARWRPAALRGADLGRGALGACRLGRLGLGDAGCDDLALRARGSVPSEAGRGTRRNPCPPPTNRVGRPARRRVAVCLALAVLPARVAVSRARFGDSLAALQRGDCPAATAAAARSLEALGRRAAPHHVVGSASCARSAGGHRWRRSRRRAGTTLTTGRCSRPQRSPGRPRDSIRADMRARRSGGIYGPSMRTPRKLGAVALRLLALAGGSALAIAARGGDARGSSGAAEYSGHDRSCARRRSVMLIAAGRTRFGGVGEGPPRVGRCPCEMSCSHHGFRGINTSYDRRRAVLVYFWTCERCGERLGEARREEYRPAFDPQGHTRLRPTPAR
jgi:hypothetical protein